METERNEQTGEDRNLREEIEKKDIEQEELVEEETVDEVEANEPPPIPKSVDDEWAEKLGVSNNVQKDAPEVSVKANPTPVFITQQKPWMQNSQNSQFKASDPMSEPMPSTWLVWSVVCTILCCFIPGIVAIIQSSRVSSRYYAGDLEGAKRASQNAEIWIIVSFVLGVLSNTLYIPLTLAGLL